MARMLQTIHQRNVIVLLSSSSDVAQSTPVTADMSLKAHSEMEILRIFRYSVYA